MHFDDTVWVDLVRGTIEPAAKVEIEQHLQTGCADCNQALAIWQSMHSSALKETAYTAPADLVRLVKQEFAIQYPKSQEKETLLAKLMFDSFAQPVPVGIRTAAAAANNARQVLYEANGITIDMRFEFQPPQRLFVVGQLLDNKNTYPMPISLVLFNEHGAAVLETQTTEFGEFQFECDIRERLRLSLELTATKRVQVPLGDAELPAT
jgi:hypothetical protein